MIATPVDLVPGVGGAGNPIKQVAHPAGEGAGGVVEGVVGGFPGFGGGGSPFGGGGGGGSPFGGFGR